VSIVIKSAHHSKVVYPCRLAFAAASHCTSSVTRNFGESDGRARPRVAALGETARRSASSASVQAERGPAVREMNILRPGAGPKVDLGHPVETWPGGGLMARRAKRSRENIQIFTYLRSYITLSRTLLGGTLTERTEVVTRGSTAYAVKSGKERACDVDGAYP